MSAEVRRHSGSVTGGGRLRRRGRGRARGEEAEQRDFVQHGERIWLVTASKHARHGK